MTSALVVVTGASVNLSDQISVASEAEVTVRDALSDGASYTVTIVYDERLERFVAESITVSRVGAGHEVTSRLVRELKVQEVVAEVALTEMTTFYVLDEDGPVGEMSGAEALSRVEPAAGRDPLVVREEAHMIYLLAKLGSWPPLVTVAERLQVSHSTAKRLIAAKRWESVGLADG